MCNVPLQGGPAARRRQTSSRCHSSPNWPRGCPRPLGPPSCPRPSSRPCCSSHSCSQVGTCPSARDGRSAGQLTTNRSCKAAGEACTAKCHRSRRSFPHARACAPAACGHGRPRVGSSRAEEATHGGLNACVGIRTIFIFHICGHSDNFPHLRTLMNLHSRPALCVRPALALSVPIPRLSLGFLATF